MIRIKLSLFVSSVLFFLGSAKTLKAQWCEIELVLVNPSAQVCPGEVLTFKTTSTRQATVYLKVNDETRRTMVFDTHSCCEETAYLTMQRGDSYVYATGNLGDIEPPFCGERTSDYITIPMVNEDPDITSFTISSSDSISCLGKPVSFEAHVAGTVFDVTYKWMINGELQYSGNNPIWTNGSLLEGDIITCKLENSNGCTTQYLDSENSIVQRVYGDFPTISLESPNCLGDGDLMINSAEELQSVTWSLLGQTILTETDVKSSSYTPQSPGDYYINILDTLGCAYQHIINIEDTDISINRNQCFEQGGLSVRTQTLAEEIYWFKDGALFQTNKTSYSAPVLAIQGTFGSPFPAVAVDNSESIYVSDPLNKQILRKKKNSTNYDNIALDSSNYNIQPFFIALNSQKDLFVSDFTFGVYRYFAPDYNQSTRVKVTQRQSDLRTKLIHVDAFDNLYVVTQNNQVLKYRNGEGVPELVIDNSSVSAITVDNLGNIITADGPDIKTWTPGNSTPVLISSSFGTHINGLKSTSAGDLYAVFGNGNVVKYAAGSSMGELVADSGLTLSEDNNVVIDHNLNLYFSKYLDAEVIKVTRSLNSTYTPVGPGDFLVGYKSFENSCITYSDTVYYGPKSVALKSDRICLSESMLTLETELEPFQLEWFLNGNSILETNGNFQTTVLGGGAPGSGLNQFNGTGGIFLDKNEDIYVADADNHRVVKWLKGSSTGIVVAGGNGAGSASNQLNMPVDVFVDDLGNIYVSDRENERVQKFEPNSSQGITVAGGNGMGSALNQLNNPYGIKVDPSGNVYIADAFNHRIMKWAAGASSGVIVAGGNGQGSQANQLDDPRDIDLDENGNLYIVDFRNSRIQKWEFGPTTTVVSTLVSGGNLDLLSDLKIIEDGTLYYSQSYLFGDVNTELKKLEPNSSSPVSVINSTDNGDNPSFLYFSLDNQSNIYGMGFHGSVIELVKFTYLENQANNQLSVDTEGNYAVTITDKYGCTRTSAPLALAFEPRSISIDYDPSVTPSLCSSDTQFLKATTVGFGPYARYRWHKNGVFNVENLGTNLLSISNTQNGDVWSCQIISNSNCTTVDTLWSNDITFSGLTPKVSPGLNLSVLQMSNCSGETLSLNAVAVNPGSNPTYAWYVNNTLLSETDPTFTVQLPSISSPINLTYECRLTNTDNCVIAPNTVSDSYALTVQPKFQPSAIISSTTSVVCAGDNVDFTLQDLTAVSSMQWYKNGLAVGSSSSMYSDAGLLDGDEVWCEVSYLASFQCISSTLELSNKITISALNPAISPGITIINANPRCETPHTFQASVTNLPLNSTITWYVNNIAVAGGAYAIFSSYYLATPQSGDTISCELTGSTTCGGSFSVTSSPIVLNISPYSTPTISIAADQSQVCSGGAVKITANTTHQGTNPSYRFTNQAGQELYNGPNNYFSVNLTNSVEIKAQMFGANGCITGPAEISNTVNINVTSDIAPSVSFPEPPNISDQSSTYAFTGESPSGGTFSGSGVSGSNFDAASVGPGVYPLSYIYMGANCANTAYTTITVLDDTAPVALCKDITVSLNPNGNTIILPEDINNNSYDSYSSIRTLFTSGYPLQLLSVDDIPQITAELLVRDDRNNIATCISTVTVSCPNIIYVNSNATGSNNGLNWTNAFTNLQDALDVNCQGVEVWVAKGTYIPSKDSDGNIPLPENNRERNFHLGSDRKVYGGFNGTETALSQRDWLSNVTVLSGDIDQEIEPDVVTFNAGDYSISGNTGNAYHVFILAGLSSAGLIDGFTIKSGNANDRIGNMTYQSITLNNQDGGGIYNASAATFSNLTFQHNNATFGGGMYNYNASPTVSKSTFKENTAVNGGGMTNYNNGRPTIVNSIFWNNNSSGYGGGIFNLLSSSATVLNTTFVKNSSANGGGIYNNGSSPSIVNTIFWNNEKSDALNISGADMEGSNSNPILNYSLTQANSLYVFNPSNPAVNIGNINNLDPHFVDLTNGNFKLKCNSSVVNLGTSVGAPTEDFIDNLRIGKPDLGAYEFQEPAPFTLTGSITNGSNPNYTGVYAISSQWPILNTNRAVFKASNFIELKPGFQVVPKTNEATVFRAEIDGICPE